jgi:hypothetical protein
MMARRNQKPKRDHNLQLRYTHIHEADRIMVDCITFMAASVDRNEATRRLWCRVARLYERAATFYGRASLGIMASVAWQKAAACFEAHGMHEDANRCKHKADFIPVYWAEDDSSGSGYQGGHS